MSPRKQDRKPLGLEALEPRLAMTSDLPVPDHVVIVFEENRAYSQIFGNRTAPFINGLATGPHGALFTQSFAIEHPSQPNYIDFFSGDNQGVTDDSVPAGVPFTTPNLGASLLAAGKTFVGYSDGLPSVGYEGAASDAYRRKHAPWVNWQNSNTNGIPAALNQPFTSFPTDFTQLPTLSFVIPDQNHDMHDGTIGAGDLWLKNNLSDYATWAESHNSLLIVTWDEDDHSDANHIFTAFHGAVVKGGTYDETFDHFDVLRTLEDMYDLPLAGASAAATRITDAFLNNPPTLNQPKALTILEDAAAQTVTLTGITAGGGGEKQALTVTAVSNNPALIPNPTVNYVSPHKAGTLSFQPVPNKNGTARITVRVRDAGFDKIPGNADDAKVVKSFLVTVKPVNDAPVLDTSHPLPIGTIKEDTTNPPGTLVSTFASPLISDIDGGPAKGIAVIGLSQKTNGKWEYSNNGGQTWIAFGNPTATSARLLAPASKVRFVPNHDFNGVALLQYVAWDRSNGLASGTIADTTNKRGGTGPYSTAFIRAKLTVTPVDQLQALFASFSGQSKKQGSGA